jgi:hypothetical protein
MARCKTWGSICSQNRAGWDFARHPQQISTVTSSTHKMSVGVFSQFLGSLSGLLDHAPFMPRCERSIPRLCSMHARQVDEAIRHPIVVKKDFLGTPDRTSQDCKD